MKKENLPFVSIIVPCRNEEKFISVCLDSIIKTDFPKEKLEILIMDGMSKDKTREIVGNYVNKYGFVKLLENPRIITPAAMNIGIKNSKGEVIIKMDAHSIYNKDYIPKCVEHLIESGADNVGGVLETIPANNSLSAKAIAICLSNLFGSGTSYFRTGTEKPREVNAVAFGCWRKRVFDKVGLFNEKMAKIEDLELNQRISRAGGKIILFPDIKAKYISSSENIFDFFSHNFTDGVWATYHLKFSQTLLVSWRHLLPMILVLSFLLFIPFVLYFWVALGFAFQVACRRKDFRFVFVMPFFFFSRHFGYGFGSLWGLIKILF